MIFTTGQRLRGLALAAAAGTTGARSPCRSSSARLPLEAGDLDPPADPFFGGGPATELSVGLAVQDCDRFETPTSYDGESAVTLWVTGGRYGHPFARDGSDAQQRLYDAVCGSAS